MAEENINLELIKYPSFRLYFTNIEVKDIETTQRYAFQKILSKYFNCNEDNVVVYFADYFDESSILVKLTITSFHPEDFNQGVLDLMKYALKENNFHVQRIEKKNLSGTSFYLIFSKLNKDFKMSPSQFSQMLCSPTPVNILQNAFRHKNIDQNLYQKLSASDNTEGLNFNDIDLITSQFDDGNKKKSAVEKKVKVDKPIEPEPNISISKTEKKLIQLKEQTQILEMERPIAEYIPEPMLKIQVSTDGLPSQLTMKVQEYVEQITGMKNLSYLLKNEKKINLLEKINQFNLLRTQTSKTLNEIKSILKNVVLKETKKKEVERNINSTTDSLIPDFQFLKLVKKSYEIVVEKQKVCSEIYQKYCQLHQIFEDLLKQDDQKILEKAKKDLEILEADQEVMRQLKQEKTLRYHTELLITLKAFDLSDQLVKAITLIKNMIQHMEEKKNQPEIKVMESPNIPVEVKKQKEELKDVLTTLDTKPKKPAKNVSFAEPNFKIEITESETIPDKPIVPEPLSSQLEIKTEKNDPLTDLNQCESIIKSLQEPKKNKNEKKDEKIKKTLPVNIPTPPQNKYVSDNNVDITFQQLFAMKRAGQINATKMRGLKR